MLHSLLCVLFVVQRIHSSSLLKGCIIKDTVWDDKGFRLFYGDEHGRVAVANVPRVCGVCVHAFVYMYLDSIYTVRWVKISYSTLFAYTPPL